MTPPSKLCSMQCHSGGHTLTWHIVYSWRPTFHRVSLQTSWQQVRFSFYFSSPCHEVTHIWALFRLSQIDYYCTHSYHLQIQWQNHMETFKNTQMQNKPLSICEYRHWQMKHAVTGAARKKCSYPTVDTHTHTHTGFCLSYSTFGSCLSQSISWADDLICQGYTWSRARSHKGLSESTATVF